MQRLMNMLILCLLGTLISTSVMACPDGQSKGAFGWCYPNIGGVVGQTAQAAKTGDWNTVAKGVGDIVITLNCPACAVVAQVAMDPKDRAMVSTIVGRGVILYSVGVPPTLVYADAATGISAAVQLRGQSQGPMPTPPAPPGRGRMIYRSTTLAACITLGSENRATIGWQTAPVFVEKTTGLSSTYPTIDLKRGDIVSSAASDCPEYAKVPGQTSVTEIALVFDDSQTVPGPAAQMKFFIWGQKTDMSVVAASQ